VEEITTEVEMLTAGCTDEGVVVDVAAHKDLLARRQ